ncbi:ribbon-helix-helix domain-containing protein [Cohnella zeiphila]|uniref:Ribbon-helix-helix domain-containing protein n=1 Tax=Cohnella zeiphila TaxID=2761120 RepID=A0A7X0SQ84_9BACL|nr:ribbon-helix-helix domain-containing protein [Cohnella zeiphila]MBB6731898.1 ribbon-helix-helix domain-containing protein [Cohnella zeiphila]
MGGNRGLINRKAISNSLRKDLADKFEELHLNTDIPKSKLLDQAVTLLLEKYGLSVKE